MAAFIVLAQMAAYAFGPPTLSYNHEVAFALVTSLGATLLYLAKDGNRNWLALPAFSGSLLGVCLFIKFPSSLSAAVVTLLAVGSTPYRSLV